jgi:hypothetical protein
MTLFNRLVEYVSACFTGIWIQSHEHDDALTEVAQMCRDENWQLAVWDIERGLHLPGQASGQTADAGGADPLAAIHALSAMVVAEQPDDDDDDEGPKGPSSAVLVLVNFHRLLQSAEIVQALARQITAGKQRRQFIVILSPIVQIPVELEKLFVVIEHDLPGRQQLGDIARGIATQDGELPVGADLDMLLDAAAGLTRYEAESAYSLSLVRHCRLQADAVWDLKCQTLKKSGLLQLYRGGEDFSSLGGLTSLKAFTRRALLQPSRSNPLKRPRGVLLLSPPGCGKSQFCKCLGRETGRPVLILDVGTLMGSLVGQTEERTRQALQIIDAMAPCVAMIDECEKAFAGVGNSGQTDSGVSSRMFGTFLSWLNDHESDVFVVCTANDVAKLPPEFSRAERFDGTFFLDFPGREQKQAIWQIYLRLFEIDRDQKLPKDDNWTGAEIRACCRLAALLDVPLVQAAQNVVPVAVTAAEAVERLRTWASGRCLDADRPGIYTGNGEKTTVRRKVSRGPLNN